MRALPRRCVIIAVLVAFVVGAAAIFVIAYRNAVADPVVRRLNLTVADYPANAPPVWIALFSDVHVHGPDMPPARLTKLVSQINALHPDMIIAAGDFAGRDWAGHEYSIGEAVAPLRRLHARLGVYAVLGNNDYAPDGSAATAALTGAGVRVLNDEAVTAGPLALGGLTGSYASDDASILRRAKVHDALERTSGVKVLIAHRPDEFHWAPASVSLMLAGHTHCGQIVLPLIGPVETGSDFGRKYVCGVVRKGSKTLVVTAGMGTSRLPMRIGAHPDVWLIRISVRTGKG